MWEFFTRQPYFSCILKGGSTIGFTLSNKVLKAIEYLLYPMVRLVIARGISYGSLVEIVKYVMIKETERQLRLRHLDAISDSRLSIITGIHRKEVKRIRALKSKDIDAYQPSLTSQVVAKWAGDKRLQSNTGPIRLLKKKTSEDAFDFEDLIKSISTDIRPRVVLDELIDRGLVTESDSSYLVLHQEKLALKQDQEETLHYLSLNVHDHLSTSVNNLIDPLNKRLDRCVHYHGLNMNGIAKLKATAEIQAMNAFTTVNKEAQELFKDPRLKGIYRMNFGAYFHHEEVIKDKQS
jgi:hypothetical protein